ncbi:MAG TPA: hypothetical protein VLB02_00770 [Candidatus Paceibacterota bacterium]|nr:hypothetical protein [Candidatus Paceibacterota bacterium]
MYTITPSFIYFTTAPRTLFLRDSQSERQIDLEAMFRVYVRESYRVLSRELKQFKDLSVPYMPEEEQKLQASLARLIEAKRVFWEERKAARSGIARGY